LYLRTSLAVNSAFITMFDFNPLFAEFRNLYYTIPLMAIVELITIILAFRYKKNDRLRTAFIFYLLADFLILLTGCILKAMPEFTPLFRSKFHNYSNSIVAWVELLCYFFYFYHILNNRGYKRVIKTLGILYSLLVLVYLSGLHVYVSPRLRYLAYLLGSVEFIFILPFCLVYFKKILTTTSGLKILKRPSFWITTGIFFFCIFSIPGYMLIDYIMINFPEFRTQFLAIFYYIPFTINFIFLAKAFSLKKELSA
jgi:hypothetical protein